VIAAEHQWRSQASVAPLVRAPRGQIRETRSCWECRESFVARKRDEVLCSVSCGRAYHIRRERDLYEQRVRRITNVRKAAVNAAWRANWRVRQSGRAFLAGGSK
jgi:hypothetical protein